MSCEEHIRTIETKLPKNIGLLYRAKTLLEEKCFKSIHFAYIHSYLNYANIAWASNYRTNLKTIHFHEKYAVCIVFSVGKLIHSLLLLGHSHKNRKDSLETRAEPAVFSL